MEFVLGEDGTVEVRPKKPALERLADVRATIGARAGEIDVEAIRRESRRAWDSVDVEDR